MRALLLFFLIIIIAFVVFLSLKLSMEKNKKKSKKEYLSPEASKKLKILGGLLVLYIFTGLVVWFGIVYLSNYTEVSRLVSGIIIIIAGLFIVSLPVIFINFFKAVGLDIDTQSIKSASRGLAFIILVSLILRGINVEWNFGGEEGEEKTKTPSSSSAIPHDQFRQLKMDKRNDKLVISLGGMDADWSGEVIINPRLKWRISPSYTNQCSVWFVEDGLKAVDLSGITQNMGPRRGRFRFKGDGNVTITTR